MKLLISKLIRRIKKHNLYKSATIVMKISKYEMLRRFYKFNICTQPLPARNKPKLTEVKIYVFAINISLSNKKN
jgi:hypothetical protein